MKSFKAASPNQVFYCNSSFFLRGDDGSRNRNQTRFTDLGELQQSVAVFHNNDALDLTSSFSGSKVGLRSNNLPIFANNPLYGSALNTSIGSSDIGPARADTGQFMYQKGSMIGAALGTSKFEKWGDSSMADHSLSQQTDTSTDLDIDDKNQLNGVQQEGTLVVDSMDRSYSQAKASDQKTLRRLAQNREAARKSRLRKKAYVQQLENSRLKLAQLEQELQRAHQQGMLIGGGIPGDQSHSVAANGALAFDMDYARWLDDHQRLINELRTGVNSQMADTELHLLVDGVMAHRDQLLRLKRIGTKADVFHMLSGMWKTPAERCFMWLGGFRSSELLKILGNHLEALTDDQLMGICNLQQSSQQAEDALSQGMEALQQSLVDALSGNIGDYMAQMAAAMAKLATIESFLHQADLLRQQTLHQLHRILTTRQAARALLAINDFSSRLRALSSLWFPRPRD